MHHGVARLPRYLSFSSLSLHSLVSWPCVPYSLEISPIARNCTCLGQLGFRGVCCFGQGMTSQFCKPELGFLWPHNVVFVLTVSYVGPVTASMAMFGREGVLSSGTPLHKCPDQSSSVQLPVHVIQP